MTVWKGIYGGYNHSPGRHDIVVAGSPAASMLGIGLAQAHAAGYGQGVGFDVTIDGDHYNVKISLNLISLSVDDNDHWDGQDGIHTRYERGQGFQYDYVLNIKYSTDGGKTYNNQVLNKTFDDPNGALSFKAEIGDANGAGQSPIYWLAYYDGWQATAAKGKWSGNFTLPKEATNITVSIVGKEAASMMPNYYTLEEIIETYRPFAIRKNGTWKSLDGSTGFLKIRKNGTFKDIAKINYTDANKPEKGTSRIRHGGTWVAQPKIGD